MTGRHRMPAWLVSLGSHLALLVGLAWLAAPAPRGGPESRERPGGIVLVATDSLQPVEYLDATDTSEASSNAVAPAAATPEGAEPLLQDLPGLPSSSEAATGVELGDLLQPASGLATPGSGTGRGMQGAPATTRVFGIEGVGNRFVYVFDRSDSMAGYGGRPLAAAKSQLLGSLRDLGPDQQFQIVFYNNRPSVFNPLHPRPAGMLSAEDRNRRLAERFVGGVTADGNTRHFEALQVALNLSPDVIYFLTDAADPPPSRSQLETVRRRFSRTGAVIHAIEFGAGPQPPGHNFLHVLAAESGGQHVYIDVTRLVSSF